LSIKKNFLFLFSSKILLIAIGIARGLVIPGILGPELYGIVGVYYIIKDSLIYSTTGILGAYPHLYFSIKSKLNIEITLKQLHDTIFTLLCLIGLVFFSCTIIYSICFYHPSNNNYKDVVKIAVILSAFDFLITSVGIMFSTIAFVEKRFDIISRMQVIESIMSLTLTLGLIFIIKIYGIFISEIATIATIYFVYYVVSRYKVTINLNMRKIVSIIKFSIPFYIGNLTFYFMRMVDRAIVAKYLSLELMGIYTLALNLTDKLRMINITLNDTLRPYFIEAMNSIEDKEKLGIIIKKFNYITSCAGGLILVNSSYLLIFLDKILPKFTKSIPITQLIILSIITLMFIEPQTQLLSSYKLKKQMMLNIFRIISGFINILLCFLAIFLKIGLVGIVFSGLISNLLFCIIILSYTHKYYLYKVDLLYYIKMFVPQILLFLNIIYLNSFKFVSVLNTLTKVFPIIVVTNILLFMIYRIEIFSYLIPLVKERYKIIRGKFKESKAG